MQNLTSGSANISRYTYGFAAPGQPQRDVRTFVESQVGSEALQRVNYSYDAVDQLTAQISTEATPVLKREYAYDAMGNRTQTNTTTANGLTSRADTHNRLNQLISHTATYPDNTTVTANLSYDASGNLTSEPNTSYSYDEAERLTSIVKTSPINDANVSRSEFIYDAFSRKVISKKYAWVNGAWSLQEEKRRIYDGMDVVQERDASNAVTVNYTRAGNIGGLLSRSVRTAGQPDAHYYSFPK